MSLEEDRRDLSLPYLTDDEDEEEEEDLLMQDKLLEELLRLRLSESSSSGSPGGLLPPKQRLRLYQPRSKVEQFKDILQESQQFSSSHNQSDDSSYSCEEKASLLRSSWMQIKEAISCIYSGILSGSSPSSVSSDLEPLLDSVTSLVWKDPHQLFLRLESAIREFVIDLKLSLIELLQKQAKNPSLAQDFIQSLLDGYEKICSAAAYISPALQELEMGHLRLFGLSWEVMNKHLYQSIIYTDPLIQNNLPIFISQLRSLYPDKEHEARYTELVRSYLDFDVEMEKIGAFWKISEPLIANYNKEQVILMEKQKMLRDDWEKFKSLRKQQQEEEASAAARTEEERGNGEEEEMGKSQHFDSASQSDDKSEEEESLSLVSESFNHLLNGIEDLDMEGIPPYIQEDVRRVLRLNSPELFPLPFQGTVAGDSMGPEPEPCNSIAAQLLRYGILFQGDTSDDDEELLEFEKDPSPYGRGNGGGHSQ